ncbi:hypothetical protein AGMMS49957_18400 [Synergistales bacterium]|nr:hypothetical protein AGMMS49957_18400 [Synergistales bacterium]
MYVATLWQPEQPEQPAGFPLPPCPGKIEPVPFIKPTLEAALCKWFDLQSVGFEFILPKNEPYYVITTLNFFKGQPAGDDICLYGKQETTPRIQGQFLWDKDGRTLLLVDGQCVNRNGPSTWGKTSGFFIQEAAFGNKGYLLFVLASTSLDYDGKDTHGSGSYFRTEVQTKQYVGVLAARSFKTREERNAFSREKAEKEWVEKYGSDLW